MERELMVKPLIRRASLLHIGGRDDQQIAQTTGIHHPDTAGEMMPLQQRGSGLSFGGKVAEV